MSDLVNDNDLLLLADSGISGSDDKVTNTVSKDNELKAKEKQKVDLILEYINLQRSLHLLDKNIYLAVENNKK